MNGAADRVVVSDKPGGPWGVWYLTMRPPSEPFARSPPTTSDAFEASPGRYYSTHQWLNSEEVTVASGAS
jgi:hypothetical protein